MRKSCSRIITGSNSQHHLSFLGSTPHCKINFSILIFPLKFPNNNNKSWRITYPLVSSYHCFWYTPVSQYLSCSYKSYLNMYLTLLIFVLCLLSFLIGHKAIVKVIHLRWYLVISINSYIIIEIKQFIWLQSVIILHISLWITLVDFCL